MDAVTFAPLNKAALHAGGWHFPDEHKMFAHLLNHQGYFSEMNVLDNQWMSRVTSHVSLREALDQITPKSIDDAIVLTDRMMRRAGIAAPRIAVAALNPHGGEGGLFGREEIDMIAPTVRKVAATGIDCRGPFPADTLYIRALRVSSTASCRCITTRARSRPSCTGFNRGVTVTGGLDTDLHDAGARHRLRHRRQGRRLHGRHGERPASRGAPRRRGAARGRTGGLKRPRIQSMMPKGGHRFSEDIMLNFLESITFMRFD